MAVDRQPGSGDGERALRRIRGYSTLSMCATVVATSAFVIAQSASVALTALSVVAAVFVTALTAYWYRTPPPWLAVVATGLSLVVWVASIAMHEATLSGILLASALAPFASRRHRWITVLVSVALLVLPACIAAAWRHDMAELFVALPVLAGYIALLLVFGLNHYAWNLALEIDRARRLSAELAVAEERYRFAADLHDIQGHTLHVIRLKLQLADRVLEGDPAAARGHLREATQLIGETLANTKQIAYGNRRVALASELANARELLSAAGISCVVTGEPSEARPEELFALLLREATTNILRHSQATEVAIDVAAGHLRVTNDGAGVAGAQSGLAVLGERFANAGGRLQVSEAAGVFTTVGDVP